MVPGKLSIRRVVLKMATIQPESAESLAELLVAAKQAFNASRDAVALRQAAGQCAHSVELHQERVDHQREQLQSLSRALQQLHVEAKPSQYNHPKWMNEHTDQVVIANKRAKKTETEISRLRLSIHENQDRVAVLKQELESIKEPPQPTTHVPIKLSMFHGLGMEVADDAVLVRHPDGSDMLRIPINSGASSAYFKANQIWEFASQSL